MAVQINEEIIFNEARNIESPEARGRYLDDACGGNATLRDRLQALLRVYEQDRSFLKPLSATMATGDSAVHEGPGSVIGPYKLLEQIGEGGFGVVFMAEQHRPVRRKVALKVLKPGMDTRQVVARFEAERQALALMEHQNISRVLDAGETATGRPFFVMELVRGVPITNFCDDNHLPVRERLRLFLDVCQAVQHAHQKGIIHRDLKPTNILVTLHDGTPVAKVIDFGIAKAVGQQLTDKTLFTGFAQMIGTPSYMSPEQAEMSGLDADTRSDIYALGILLYELLTGTTPCEQERLRTVAFDEIRRIIREEEPPRPSTRISTMGNLASTVSTNRRSDPRRLSQLFQGELDWIVMKALEKDRNRRYETASALAADVQRYLNDEPVLARPPSSLYRLRKTMRRHQGPFIAAVLIMLALVVGIIAALWGLIRATDAESAVRAEATQKEDALKDKESALATAKASERDAREQLFLSLLNQARAGRFSRQMGQRLDSLDALAKAARLRRDDRLRDEAIAAMALPDIRPGPSWHALPPGYHYWSFDDNYRLFARANYDGIISVRTIPDDREIQEIRTEPTKVEWILLSPDGRYVARLEIGRKLRLWRVSDGKEIIREPLAPISVWNFSSDSRQLVVGQKDWLLRFDVATGQELNRWQLPDKSKAYGLAFHPDNRRLAVGHVDSKIVSIYDSSNGELVANLPVGTSQNQVVAWHPDGNRLAVAKTQLIQIWDVDAKRKLATLEGHVQQVDSLSFHPDGALLASDSWDGVLRLWDTSTGRPLMQLTSRRYTRFSSDGRWLGAGTRGEDAHLLEVTPTREYRTLVSKLEAGQGDFLELDISPDGRLLAVAMGASGVHLWDLPSGRPIAALPNGIPLFHSDARELLICNGDGMHRYSISQRLKLLRNASGIEAASELVIGPPRTIPLPGPPRRVARSQDSRTLGMVCESKGIGWLVDLDSETVRKERMDHAQAAFLALSPDAKWMATGGWHSDKVRLWNARTGELVREWPLFRTIIFFTPDSRVLILSRGDEFSFHDVESGNPLHRIRRDVALYPGHVAFAPKTGLMALEMEPGVVHLKDIATGKTVARLEDPHGDRATWMGFTPDGSQLVVNALYAKAIHVWDLRAIRSRLKSMNLDWDWPEFSADPSKKSLDPPG